ncbi:snaclec alboaggregin-A subunit beta'-like [Syngnathus scovelli]|uniref:snaclec alboaggregin-A subunit beta'-like n=1 Tax=Syngnathus scovelli TaxID=161590 RepID=UPI002110B17C|nr:secretory phospholipase A2 receptor-like [Syngnathus scovelli]
MSVYRVCILSSANKPWSKLHLVVLLHAPHPTVTTLGARTTFCEGISCGPGWEAFSSSCYKKMLDPNGWLGARFHCVLEGGDLVSFNSSAEEDFVKGKIGARSFWIGLSNLECNHKLCPQVSGKELKWSDNTLLNHSNWAPAEAASTKLESCAYVPRDANKYHHPGKWRKVSCESSLAYMCKRSPDSLSGGTTVQQDRRFGAHSGANFCL